MKKLLLLFVALLSFIAANAQYRFYAGLEGGPKISYTQNTGYQIHSTAGKRSWQYGTRVGYKFSEERFLLETGLTLARFDILAHYTPDDKFFRASEDAELNIAYTAWQIPLRIKANLLPSASKLQIRPLFGIVLMMKNSHTIKPKSLYDIPLDRFGYRTVKGEKDSILVTIPHDSGGSFSKTNLFLLESGLELGYKITPKAEVIWVISYQTGLNISDSFILYYKYHEQEWQNLENFVTVTSKAEALSFNIGLTYSFSKRK
jgi:hypothetical protein